MSKGIAAFFFILAFLVFAFAKYAAKGIKQAYKAVNEDDTPELTRLGQAGDTKLRISDHPLDMSGAIISLINESLDLQIVLSAQKVGNLTLSDYVIGYLAGYADVVLRANAICKQSSDGAAIYRITFAKQFGSQGAVALKKFNILQSDPPSEMQRGLIEGQQDMTEYLGSNGNFTPTKLARYFQQIN